MKFCKNLQRVVDISDPEWAPYWTNYKMLKKLIKELPSLVPNTDDGENAAPNGNKIRSDSNSSDSGLHQIVSPTTSSENEKAVDKIGENTKQEEDTKNAVAHNAETMGKSPGERAFFKLLHSEFKKASHFFDRATEEFAIREERVREGMEIMRKPNSIMVNEKWGLMAKSIYRLYKDLLLLETFAIMTYCSFSKILKKHDKVTKYDTKNAFMSNIVNKANFTHYPRVLSMITRCEKFYEEVSANLLKEGKERLYEDERLFINMIHRLNEQVLESPDGASLLRGRKPESAALLNAGNNVGHGIHSRSDQLSSATSTLRNLVEENAKQPNPTKLPANPLNTNPQRVGSGSEATNNGEDGDDDDSDIVRVGTDNRPAKRQKITKTQIVP